MDRAGPGWLHRTWRTEQGQRHPAARAGLGGGMCPAAPNFIAGTFHHAGGAAATTHLRPQHVAVRLATHGDCGRLPAGTGLEWFHSRHLIGTPLDAGAAPVDRTACAAGLPAAVVVAAALHARPVQRPHPGFNFLVVSGDDAAGYPGRPRLDHRCVAVAPALAGAGSGYIVLFRRSVLGIQHGGAGAIFRAPQLPAGDADVLAFGAVVVQCTPTCAGNRALRCRAHGLVANRQQGQARLGGVDPVRLGVDDPCPREPVGQQS